MADSPAAGDHHLRWFYAPPCSSSSSRLTDFNGSTAHRSALESEEKSCFSMWGIGPSGQSGEEMPPPVSSSEDPVKLKATNGWDRSPDLPALDQWQEAQHSTPNDGHNLAPEVTADLEKHTPPFCALDSEGSRALSGSGRQMLRKTKDGGDAEGGQETSCSSCFEESNSSNQAIWWSVTDCSLSLTDQEKKRVSFGDCSTHCEPEKRSNAHKRSILKTTAVTAPPHVTSGPATEGSEGGGEGTDEPSEGATDEPRSREEISEGPEEGPEDGPKEGPKERPQDGGWSEREIKADKIVNSAALTKKRLRKRSTITSTQHRHSSVFLFLSGHFPTPARTQSAGVAGTAAGLVVRRRSELSIATGSRRGQLPELDLSGLSRGIRQQTPPSQWRRRCFSSGGIVNESYREDEEDKEDDEETDNERNADRLGRGGSGRGEASERRTDKADVLRLTGPSTCYLVHLRDTNRIPKHVDHIIRKFNLRLLEPENASNNNNIVDMETALAAENGRATTKQPMAATVVPTKKESDDIQPTSISSCLEEETSKTRSLSLRRRLSLRFSKKPGCLDKSKSVPGSSTLAGGGGSSKDETMTMGPSGVWVKRPTTPGVEDSKGSESYGAAGSSEDQTTESVTSDATYRAQKKAPRWRKLSLHIFRKSRDGMTEEAAQHQQPQTQQPTKDAAKVSDESSRDKNDGAWTAQPPPAPPETSEGTSAGLTMAKPKRTSSEASKVLSCAQQKNWAPVICQDPDPETKTKAKAESNRELAIQQLRTSQRPLTMTTTDTSSSDVIVPLVAKTSLVFHDAVFYFPSKDKDDEDEANDGWKGASKGTLTAASAAKSEGKVPKPSKSSSLRLPLKGVISETSDRHQLRQRRGPPHLERRRSSLLLKRIRAFFGRSSGSAEEPDSEDTRTTEELQLLTRQDLQLDDQCKTSSSMLLLHPNPPAPHQLNESFPLLQAESSDTPAAGPPSPPLLPHKHSSSSTLTFPRHQSSSENQLIVSVNRRSLDPFVPGGRKRSAEEGEKSGRRRVDESID